jgi:hypothetical protein
MASGVSSQSGSISFGTGELLKTATITAVVLANTTLWVSCRGGNDNATDSSFTWKMLNTTTIEFERKGAPSLGTDNPVIEWVVLSSTDFTVQNVAASGTTNVGITAVVLANSFIQSNGHHGSGTGYDDGDTSNWSLTSTTVARCETVSGTNRANAQVISDAATTVQQFDVGSKTADWTQAITAVVLADTALFASGSFTSGTSRNNDDIFRVALTSTVLVSGDCVLGTGASATDINLFVVEWDGDATSVQSGTFTDTTSDDNQTITAVVISESVGVLCAATSLCSSHTRNPDILVDFGDNLYTNKLTTTTNLLSTRTDPSGTSMAAWFVISFAPAAAQRRLLTSHFG